VTIIFDPDETIFLPDSAFKCAGGWKGQCVNDASNKLPAAADGFDRGVIFAQISFI
jgi:hypothetical protein